jgi:hypothetical protein
VDVHDLDCTRPCPELPSDVWAGITSWVESPEEVYYVTATHRYSDLLYLWYGLVYVAVAGLMVRVAVEWSGSGA